MFTDTDPGDVTVLKLEMSPYFFPRGSGLAAQLLWASSWFWFALHFSLCSSSLESRFLTDMMSTQLPYSAVVPPLKSHWTEARRQPRTSALQSCSRIRTKPFKGFVFSGRGTTVNSVHRVLWLPQGCRDYARGHKSRV